MRRLLVLITLALSAGCASAPRGTYGLEAVGVEVYLGTEDPKVVDAVVRRAQQGLARIDPSEALTAALPRARERARALLAGQFPKVDPALAALRSEQVQLEQDATRPVFEPEALLGATASFAISDDAAEEPVALAEGVRLAGRLTLAIAPWPRDPERFLPQPGLVLAQAGVLYAADLPGASFAAQLLAEELVARVSALVEAAAQHYGLAVDRPEGTH